jgi:hypothetical protein
MNNEPIAWYKENSNVYLIENIGQPSFQVQEFIDAGYIPVYTHPVKDLEDIDINITWNETSMRDFGKDELAFARAILRKASEK